MYVCYGEHHPLAQICLASLHHHYDKYSVEGLAGRHPVLENWVAFVEKIVHNFILFFSLLTFLIRQIPLIRLM